MELQKVDVHGSACRIKCISGERFDQIVISA